MSNKNRLEITVLSNANTIEVLNFDVHSVAEAAKIYQDIKKTVKEIQTAIYSNNLIKGNKQYLSETNAKDIYEMFLQQEIIKNIQNEHEKHYDNL